MNLKFHNAMQLYDAVAQRYSRDSARLVSDCISMKFEALVMDLSEQSVEIRR